MDIKRPTITPARHFLVFLLLFITSFLIYHHILRGEFVSDDRTKIIENTFLRDPFDLPRIWQGMKTRSLTGWTFAWNYALGGLDPFGYHLVNVLIHTLNAMLVYGLTLLMMNSPAGNRQNSISRPPGTALFAALIFLCHPVQTQGVSFIFQRSASLAAFFYLLTLVLYAVSRQTGSRTAFAGALLAMTAGIFCKENVLTLPLALWGFDRFFLTDDEKKEPFLAGIKRVLPFVLLAGLVPLLLLLGGSGASLPFKDQIATRSFSFPYFLTEANALVTYLRLFIWPVNLMHDYDYRIAQGILEPRTFFSLILLAVIIWAGVRSFKKDRVTSFCIFWFFVTTSVEAGAVCLVNRGVIFEHWLYLPMAGLSILAASGMSRVIKNGRALRITGTAVVCLLGVLTYQRNFVWQNEQVFWEDNLKKAPGNARVNFAAGSMYLRKGNTPRAERLLSRALTLNSPGEKGSPGMDRELASQTLNNLGLIRLREGRFGRAADFFQKAVKVWPGNARAQNNLGICLFETGQREAARKSFEAALRLQGDYAYGRFYLGRIALEEGRRAEAGQDLRRALELFREEGNREMAGQSRALLEGAR